jgi:sulfonate transport system substrate-binding protein
MNIPAELGKVIGENNAVPTTAVTATDVEQIGKIADWYAKSGIIPRKPDIKAAVVELK